MLTLTKAQYRAMLMAGATVTPTGRKRPSRTPWRPFRPSYVQAFSITIAGNPIAQPRPRQGRIRSGKRAGERITYTPGMVREWKKKITEGVLAVARFKPLVPEGYRVAATVRLTFLFATTPQMVPFDDGFPDYGPHREKPDADNLIKPVLDAITEAGVVWADDCVVDEVAASKKWAGPEEHAGVRITICLSVEKAG